METIIEIIKNGYGWYLLGGLLLSGIIAEILSQVKYECSTLNWRNLAIGAFGTYIGLPVLLVGWTEEVEALVSLGQLLFLISWIWNLIFTARRSNFIIAILAIPSQTLLSLIAAIFVSSTWDVIKEKIGI